MTAIAIGDELFADTSIVEIRVLDLGLSLSPPPAPPNPILPPPALLLPALLAGGLRARAAGGL